MESIQRRRAHFARGLIFPVAASVLLARSPLASDDAGYVVERAASDRAAALLAADDAAWGAARVVSWGPPAAQTSFRALADTGALFVRFDVRDPHSWSTLTRRDARLWSEEVVEIFIARPGDGGDYVELQINPANAVADLRVEPARRRFDDSWNFAGLETRAHARRDGSGAQSGWCAVARLPWRGFERTQQSGIETEVPRAGRRWRFNVFRIERPGGQEQPEAGALFLAWSPTPSRSFHAPEAFVDLVFR